MWPSCCERRSEDYSAQNSLPLHCQTNANWCIFAVKTSQHPTTIFEVIYCLKQSSIRFSGVIFPWVKAEHIPSMRGELYQPKDSQPYDQALSYNNRLLLAFGTTDMPRVHDNTVTWALGIRQEVWNEKKN